MVTPIPLTFLDPDDSAAPFPSVDQALRDPNGLLAFGGDLTPTRLLAAYRQGIFPWYSEDQPILWWSPDPRAVLYPDRLHVSHSLNKTLLKKQFAVTADTAFRRVIELCAAPRTDAMGTWLTTDMIEAYCRLHELGHAHSIETWQENELVGGLYGVALGSIFFGESMFSRTTNASKVAFVHLVRHLQNWGFSLIDCQISSAHLKSLGAEEIPRRQFSAILKTHCDAPARWGRWEDSNEQRR